MSSPRIVVVFVKLPVAEKVKTRLAAGLTGSDCDQQAAEIYKKLTATVFEIISRSLVDHVYIAYDPPEKESAMRQWLSDSVSRFSESVDITFHAQPQGDLGVRVQTAVDDALSTFPNAKVAAIGTDCVEITPGHFAETWDALDSHDVVFGPTFDGGYYLVATQTSVPEIFQNIPWSTDQTLPTSIAAAEKSGLTVFQLTKQNDVDTAEDWETAKERVVLR